MLTALRSALLALVLVCLVVPFTAGVSGAAPKPRAKAPDKPIGVAYGDTLMWLSDAQLGAALDDAVALGADWVRADLQWRNIQPDSPDQYLWYRFDRIVLAANQRGLQVMPLVTYTPAWARDPGCDHFGCAPRDPAEFANFARLAAQRYSPYGVHTWEIWNEENYVGFWRPAPDPARYAALLRSTSLLIHGVDPTARVLMGGMAAVPTTSNGNIDPREFLDEVCELGACEGLDGVAYHPYTWPALASDTRPGGTPWMAIGTMDWSLRSVLDANGYHGLKIWVTEFGAPTGGPGTASDGSPGSWTANTDHVTEQRQAQIASDGVQTAVDDPDVGAFFWYTYHDNPRAATKEDFYGLHRADSSKKPAWAAFSQAITRVSSAARR